MVEKNECAYQQAQRLAELPIVGGRPPHHYAESGKQLVKVHGWTSPPRGDRRWFIYLSQGGQVKKLPLSGYISHSSTRLRFAPGTVAKQRQDCGPTHRGEPAWNPHCGTISSSDRSPRDTARSRQ